MKNKEKSIFSPAQRTFSYVTGGEIGFDAVISRLVLVVQAGDAGENLTLKELQ